ncbi:hypothetical protein [Phenylobacterium sp.]|uniref:hypothetical protein n=1 Tax=Phenylobacterium sp. TaxID=1871053 RepID=UPI002DEC100D|nr:hypothetical protein [Phenylobacterium sp.]
MRIRAVLTAAFAGLALAGAAAAAPPPPAADQPLVITADDVHQAHGVSTWTGHVAVSGVIDPARTAVTLDGRPSPSLDLSTLPPLASARLTPKGHGKGRARLDLVSKR